MGAGTALLLVGDVDPMDQMLSDSVQSWPGAVLLAVAASALAAAGAWLQVGARRELPRGGPLAPVLTVWCVALLAVAVFPTNLPGTEPGLTAMIHRAAAALVAALPPLFTLLIVRRIAMAGGDDDPGEDRGRPGSGKGRDGAGGGTGIRLLRVVGWGTAAACGLFALVNGPAVLAEQGLPPYAGLLERVLLVLVLLAVGLCGRLTHRVRR
ncbi:DUF998 domain-containing protein [Actinoplanes couchii]|uniref:DUF998 domain-containing protein n=1 Tax=Actinoplanes couchii TaxID=403638 RepID=UPI0023B2CA21|nr:DUF998 domain-containing protein [Actinoplanes couchii]